MYNVLRHNSFKKDYKRCKKRGYDLELMKKVLSDLIEKGEIPKKFLPHKLSGNYKGRWECI